MGLMGVGGLWGHWGQRGCGAKGNGGTEGGMVVGLGLQRVGRLWGWGCR